MSRGRRQLVAFILVAIVSLYAAIVSTKNQVDVHRIEPQVTQVIRANAVCRSASFGHPKLLRACAHRIQVGLSVCREDLDCRSAFLALMESSRRGVVLGGGNPSHGLEPGQGESPGPENQPSSPSSPGSKPPLGPVVNGVQESVDHVQETVGGVVEGACAHTEALHLC